MKNLQILLIPVLIDCSLSLHFRPHHQQQILGRDTIKKIQDGSSQQYKLGKTQTYSQNSAPGNSEEMEVQERNIYVNYNEAPKQKKDDDYYLDVEGGGEWGVQPQKDDPNIIITKPIQFNPFAYPLGTQESIKQASIDNQLDNLAPTSEELEQNDLIGQLESTQLAQEPLPYSYPQQQQQQKEEQDKKISITSVNPLLLPSPEVTLINTLPISIPQTIIKGQQTSQSDILPHQQRTQENQDAMNTPFSMDPIVIVIPSSVQSDIESSDHINPIPIWPRTSLN